MATMARGLFRLSFGSFNHQTLCRTVPLTVNSRKIYSDRSLGIITYEHTRMHYRNQFINIESSFRSKMEESCSKDVGMIFTEDLKAMLHLVQKQEDDINLIKKMIQKYNTQYSEYRFGSYIFGPVVMRMLYYLDEPQVALSLFNDPNLEQFFAQFTTYQILMSLLLKHSLFADVREVYTIIQDRLSQSLTFPMNILIVLAASCYKEQTPEALEHMLRTFRTLKDKNVIIPRRALGFTALLAIKQNAAYIAIEFLNLVGHRDLLIKSLIILAYTKLQKYTEIIPLLRSNAQWYANQENKQQYFHDVIDLLESEIRSDPNTHSELLALIQELRQNQSLTLTSLEAYLLRPIDRPSVKAADKRNERRPANNTQAMGL